MALIKGSLPTALPHNGDEIQVGWTPPTSGRIILIATRNATTVGDPGDPIVKTETREIQGLAKATNFRLSGDGPEWSSGGADVVITLEAPDSVLVSELRFTVLP